MENIYRFFQRNSWQFPIAIAVLITPFMFIGSTTENEKLGIFSKIVWLFLVLLFLAYNLTIRYLRKKFEGHAKP